MAKIGSCPVTKQQFADNANPLRLTMEGGREVVIPLKEFATGSFGWYGIDKFRLDVDGKSCPVQLTVSATVIGSKDLAN